MAEMTKQGGMPPKKPGEPVSVPGDIQPLIDDIKGMMGEGGQGPGTSPKPDEAQASTGEGAPKAEGEMGGAEIIAEVLGVSMEKAQALLDAAMAMPRFAGKSPAEIAQMLDKDMNLRMQLEKNLGAGEDMKMKGEMAEEKKAPPTPSAPDMM